MAAPRALLSQRYRLVKVIAAGGMGVVWEGWDELLERPVAVKQLRTQPGVSEEEAETAKNRAMREARIAARLHHPNAVPVFDAVEQDGQPCLVMQFVPSTPLSAVLRDDGPIAPREAARIGAQIASALAAAHELGIVHRDVKPGNVLLAEDGRALISDFGISRALGDSTLTSTGLVHGTPAYLAPEVARGDESSFSSDVFSLGSTLHAAVEGAPPFGADANSIAVLHRVAMGDFTPPRHAGALAPLLLEMLAADPARRPSMRDVATRLEALRGSAESEPTTRLLPGRDTTPDETAAFDDGSRPTAVLPVAAAAAGIGAAAAAEAPADAPAEAEPEPVADPEPGTDAQPELVADPDPVAEAEPADPADATPEHRAGAAGAVAAAAAEGPRSDPVLPESVSAPSAAPVALAEAPAPPEPTEPTDEGTVEGPRRRRGAGWLIAAIAVLVLAGLVALGLLLARGPAPTPSPSTRPHSSAAGTASPSASSTSPSPSPSPSTPSPTPTPTPTPSATPSATSTPSAPPVSGPPTSRQLASAIRGYFALLPENTDAAWNRLTPSFQQGHAQGRAYFDSFWSRYSSVTASHVSGDAPDHATATLTYVAKDGTRTVERDTFRLVRQGGVLKIDSQTTG
ncbi:MAG: serine/threonine-protein kinase [Amnibacterium sp.]